ncbi:patatin-like phospholipase family protein [Belnapia sp. T6]|uniref:Patatin-like phospholipase family protein n=1 Tax=Belnapia mucosa TaxID=2804532 RepID=A0ABS1VCQ8_9PROT|nr:patatin-like phospholipase family protein [Belnapia mucosa]MBL6459464.1 patatin-like phospholipase family protein [Belnapia mucosa]
MAGDGRKFKILSLDGGGSWALLQVMALREIYSGATNGRRVLADFDLVAANSGGSIVLGGLVEDKTLAALLDDYFLSAARRTQIFSKASFLRNPLNRSVQALLGIGAKYDAEAKLEGLRELLPRCGSLRVSDLPGEIAASTGRRSPHFLIATFDYDRRRAVFFCSNKDSLAASGAPAVLPSLAEAIHASTNAPINYFDEPAVVAGRRFWDGGIAGYNNPVLAAITEALANGHGPEEIEVLSIGTGTVVLPDATGAPGEDPRLVQAREGPNLIRDLKKLATSILDDPPDAATFIAHVAMQQPLPEPGRSGPVPSSLIRLNPQLRPVRGNDQGAWEPPGGFTSEAFEALTKIDMDAVADHDVALIRHLGLAWIAGGVPNQPIRANSQTLACEIGYPTFAAAKTAWQALIAPARTEKVPLTS